MGEEQVTLPSPASGGGQGEGEVTLPSPARGEGQGEGEVTLPSPARGGGQGGGWTAEFPLVGPAGEVIDLRRVFLSHGIAELPPMRLDQMGWTFEITVPLAGLGARTLYLRTARTGPCLISYAGTRST